MKAATDHGSTGSSDCVIGLQFRTRRSVFQALVLLVLGAVSASAVPNTLTFYSRTGSTISNKPEVFMREFPVGTMFANSFHCPKVYSADGLTAYTTQVEVKKSWVDGSVQQAMMAFVAPTEATTGTQYLIQDSGVACSNGTGLTQAQMLAFDTGTGAGSWNAKISFTAASYTATIDSKTILTADNPASNSWGDCKVDYWMRGSVVTAVLVQDCTSATAYDVGWKWDGTNMTGTGGVAYTGNCGGASPCYASLHPSFMLWFFPSNSTVKADIIYENSWTTRYQNQRVDIAYMAGASGATVLSTSGSRNLTGVTTTAASTALTAAAGTFQAGDVGNNISFSSTRNETIITAVNGDGSQATLGAKSCTDCAVGLQNAALGMIFAGQAYMKTFWSGTEPGFSLIDYNFPYLISTKVFPNYDQQTMVRNAVDPTDLYDDFIAMDKGDRGGAGTMHAWSQNYGGNNEGAPVQMEPLEYLYAMGIDCGTANGKCAKAYYLNTAERGSADSSLAASVTGGAGMWRNYGNVPFRLRELRTSVYNDFGVTGTSFYCPNYDSKNLTIGQYKTGGCGSPTSTPVGRVFSRHFDAGYYHKYSSIEGLSNVGPVSGAVASSGGWDADDDLHWLEYTYEAYLLQGNPFYQQEVLFSGGWWQAKEGALCFMAGLYGCGPFSFTNPSAAVRSSAAGIQALFHASVVAVDNSPESKLFRLLTQNQIEGWEALQGLTGTPLTPTDTSCHPGTWNDDLMNVYTFAKCYLRRPIADYNVGDGNQVPTNLHIPGIGTCGQDSYLGYTDISAATAGATTTITVTDSAKQGGSQVYVWGLTGNWAVLNGWHNATAPDGTHLVLDYNSTGVTGAISGSGHVANGYVNYSAASDFDEPWIAFNLNIVIGEIDRFGEFNATALRTDLGKGMVEQFTSTDYNPYMVALYERGIKQGANACTAQNFSLNPFFTTWGAVKGSAVGYYQTVATFDGAYMWQPLACSDHGYWPRARGALMYATDIISTDAHCAGGNCTGTAAKTWADTYGPYFTNSPSGSTNCSVWGDTPLKYALASFDGGAPSCTVDQTTLPAATVGVAYSQQLSASNCNSSTWSGWTSCHNLTLSSSGLLSGTPDAAATCGPYSVAYDTASQSLSVTIDAGEVPPARGIRILTGGRTIRSGTR